MGTYEEHLANVVEELTTMLKTKHHDYGIENLKKFGYYGIIIRLSDKQARLENLLKKENEVENEKIEDTLLDMAGYALQAILLLKEQL